MAIIPGMALLQSLCRTHVFGVTARMLEMSKVACFGMRHVTYASNSGLIKLFAVDSRAHHRVSVTNEIIVSVLQLWLQASCGGFDFPVSSAILHGGLHEIITRTHIPAPRR